MASFQEMTFSELLSDAEVFVDGDWVESKDQDPNGDVRLIQLADIGDGFYIDKSSRFLNSETAKRLKCTYLKEGDILVARMPDPLGRACIFPKSEKPCVTVVDVCIIRPNPNKVDNRWLMHTINLPVMRQRINEYVTGTTRQRISRGNFSKLKISVPPLAEQRRIAAILDQADVLRQKRQQAIEKLDRLLQATFIDMFGDPNTYQNRFPIKSLKQVCTKITDGEHGTVERLESGKLYLMARNITKNMTLDITEVSYISEEDHQRIYKRCSPEFGDLMIVCVGATIGKLCLVPDMEEFSLARSVALLKPDNNSVISQYLLHLLASDYMQQKILNSRNTAAQAGLYLGKLSIIEVPVPPKELQEKWSKIALSIEDQKQKLYKQLDIQNQLFISLQNQAFNGTL
ncbi:restriction endonuclease subunit S [Acinetobacter bereziniae]|uniref:restriction endonuclease subunit S n=1 Tax=Acinetobacter bereziniae TaxID=106648 RepID=UPI0039C43CAA